MKRIHQQAKREITNLIDRKQPQKQAERISNPVIRDGQHRLWAAFKEIDSGRKRHGGWK